MLRPRFESVIPCQPTLALSSFALRLKQPDCPYTGRIIQERHIILRMAPAERHVWSPVLSVDAHDHPEGTLLRGYFGPHPDVWTLLIALYAAIAFGTLLGCMYGFSQWLIQAPPVALWSLPAGLLLAACVYGVALLGQRLAQAQMLQLRDFFACTACHPQLEALRARLVDTSDATACRVCEKGAAACGR
ncbi:MAG: hypothetical protein ACO1RX_07575 [Candidatus Sericytochromatia bacterium]